jgi:hypothetical protein
MEAVIREAPEEPTEMSVERRIGARVNPVVVKVVEESSGEPNGR